MSDKHKCPTCGSLVTVSTADEGTSCFMPVQDAVSLADVIEILEAEPETISTSASFRQGYVRCVRDKVKALEQRFGDNQ